MRRRNRSTMVHSAPPSRTLSRPEAGAPSDSANFRAFSDYLNSRRIARESRVAAAQRRPRPRLGTVLVARPLESGISQLS
jgi:hypothetical protein